MPLRKTRSLFSNKSSGRNHRLEPAHLSQTELPSNGPYLQLLDGHRMTGNKFCRTSRLLRINCIGPQRDAVTAQGGGSIVSLLSEFGKLKGITKMANAQTATTSVIDYIVQRLADEGITDCFGVPGDYAFPVCDAVERNPKVEWIGCSNELNASYAADGYARVRGAAMLSTTYAVGELSALNGVMGAKAERSLVYHVVGMPSYQSQRLRKTMHHTLGDGVFDKFINISAQAACCHAVINPDNCVIEMERVIAEARRNNQPAYIVVPSDYALAPITLVDVRPVTIKSNETSLQKAVAAITERLNSAKSAVALPAFTISRLGLQKEARAAIEAIGCPFATTAMEKCIIDESHPQFAGMYRRAVHERDARDR